MLLVSIIFSYKYSQDESIEHDIQNGAYETHVDHYRLNIGGEVVRERSLLIEQILALPILYFLLSRDASTGVTVKFFDAFRVSMIG